MAPCAVNKLRCKFFMHNELKDSSVAGTGPIDIVYLWVDGNDPVWRLKRARKAALLSKSARTDMALHGNVEGRFRDNDELKYSLRALERFFPGHGHSYLVTDAQIPLWLRQSDRVTVIDHKDLIPACALPTFDSGHIESYLHRIDGLSERFFYFNDDVFFGAPVYIEDWFFDGGSYAAWSHLDHDNNNNNDNDLHACANTAATENASRLSKQWFDANPQFRSVPADSFRTFAHAPRPLLKSALAELEKQQPELFAKSRSTVFRAWNQPSLICDFALRWGLAHGLTRIRDYSHLYVSTGAADAAIQLGELMASWGQVSFFCVNDTTDDAQANDPRLLEAREALQHMFPRPSSFEHAAQADVCAPAFSNDSATDFAAAFATDFATDFANALPLKTQATDKTAKQNAVSA